MMELATADRVEILVLVDNVIDSLSSELEKRTGSRLELGASQPRGKRCLSDDQQAISE